MSGRIRTIKPELLEDAVVARLSDKAFRLYIGSYLLADDYGNLRAEPRRLMGDVFWGSEDTTVAAIEAATVELLDAGSDEKNPGLLALYRVRQQTYAHIRNWEKHQKVDHPGNPRCPNPKDKESESFRPNSNLSRTSPETVAPDPDLRSPISDHDHRPLSSSRPGSTAGSDEPTNVVDSNLDTEAPTEAASQASTLSHQQPLLAHMPSPEAEVFQHWVEGWRRTTGGIRTPKLDAKRRAKIRGRLREGFTVKDLKLAVDGLWSSAWHLGENPDGKRYTDIELVCRDTSHVERFMGLATEQQPPEEQPSLLTHIAKAEEGPRVPAPPGFLKRMAEVLSSDKPELLKAIEAEDAKAGADVRWSSKPK